MDFKLELVVLPVSDVERAKEFYADRLGFNVDVDHKASEPVAIVSQSMARKFWADGRALDGRVRIDNGSWLRVVGICGDMIQDWFLRRNAAWTSASPSTSDQRGRRPV